MTTETKTADDHAAEIAKLAQETMFSAHRGAVACNSGGEPAVAIFGNDSSTDPRTIRCLEILRERLRSEGFEELGYGTFPPEGEDQDYTWAMIVRSTGRHDVPRVTEWLWEAWRQGVGGDSTEISAFERYQRANAENVIADVFDSSFEDDDDDSDD